MWLWKPLSGPAGCRPGYLPHAAQSVPLGDTGHLGVTALAFVSCVIMMFLPVSGKDGTTLFRGTPGQLKGKVPPTPEAASATLLAGSRTVEVMWRLPSEAAPAVAALRITLEVAHAAPDPDQAEGGTAGSRGETVYRTAPWVLATFVDVAVEGVHGKAQLELPSDAELTAAADSVIMPRPSDKPDGTPPVFVSRGADGAVQLRLHVVVKSISADGAMGWGSVVAVPAWEHVAQPAERAVTSTTPGSITAFDDARLEWHNGTPQHTIDEAGALTVTPTPRLDYWSKTFYDPLLVKHDAQTLLTPVAADVEATLTTAFTLKPRAQFDQAGIMVVVDKDVWVKAGIEYTDGSPRLSCVVTNEGFSDWSTQHWPDWDEKEKATSIRVRLSKLLPGEAQGPCLVFEAAPWPAEGATAETDAPWAQIRIASLRSGARPWQLGLFAISPIEAAGSSARFHHVALGPKQEPVHSADAGL